MLNFELFFLPFDHAGFLFVPAPYLLESSSQPALTLPYNTSCTLVHTHPWRPA